MGDAEHTDGCTAGLLTCSGSASVRVGEDYSSSVLRLCCLLILITCIRFYYIVLLKAITLKKFVFAYCLLILCFNKPQNLLTVSLFIFLYFAFLCSSHSGDLRRLRLRPNLGCVSLITKSFLGLICR